MLMYLNLMEGPKCLSKQLPQALRPTPGSSARYSASLSRGKRSDTAVSSPSPARGRAFPESLNPILAIFGSRKLTFYRYFREHNLQVLGI